MLNSRCGHHDHSARAINGIIRIDHNLWMRHCDSYTGDLSHSESCRFEQEEGPSGAIESV